MTNSIIAEKQAPLPMIRSFKDPSVSLHYLNIISNTLSRMGHPNAEILVHTNGYSEDDFYFNRVSIEVLFGIWQQAETISGDPLIGLHVGERIHPMDYGLLGQLMMNCETLKEALTRILSVEFILNNAFVSQVIIENNKAINRIFVHQYDAEQVRHVVEQDIAALINIGVFIMNRDYTDENRPLEVHFRHSAHGPVSEYERALRCKVKFNQDFNQVIYPQAILATRTYSPSPRIATLIQGELQSLLDRIEAQDSMTTRLWRFFQIQQSEINTDIDKVAKSFSMTTRTLQRHLKSEGTSFNEEVRRHKITMARNLLNSNSYSIAQVAEKLGFNDSGSFHKAFKRWTGMTPRSYVLKKDTAGD